jgi:hypothetical protein
MVTSLAKVMLFHVQPYFKLLSLLILGQVGVVCASKIQHLSSFCCMLITQHCTGLLTGVIYHMFGAES